MGNETDIVLQNLHNAKSMTAFFDENKELFVHVSIGQYIEQEIQSRKLTKAKIIRESGINKRYFMDILAGKKMPTRRYIIRIFLALGLELCNVQWYLKACGYHQLYVRDKRDCIIMYCVDHKLSVKECNAMLNRIGQENLGFENI